MDAASFAAYQQQMTSQSQSLPPPSLQQQQMMMMQYYQQHASLPQSSSSSSSLPQLNQYHLPLSYSSSPFSVSPSHIIASSPFVSLPQEQYSIQHDASSIATMMMPTSAAAIAAANNASAMYMHAAAVQYTNNNNNNVAMMNSTTMHPPSPSLMPITGTMPMMSMMNHMATANGAMQQSNVMQMPAAMPTLQQSRSIVRHPSQSSSLHASLSSPSSLAPPSSSSSSSSSSASPGLPAYSSSVRPRRWARRVVFLRDEVSGSERRTVVWAPRGDDSANTAIAGKNDAQAQAQAMAKKRPGAGVKHLAAPLVAEEPIVRLNGPINMHIYDSISPAPASSISMTRAHSSSSSSTDGCHLVLADSPFRYSLSYLSPLLHDAGGGGKANYLFACPQCPRIFASGDEQRRHYLGHAGIVTGAAANSSSQALGVFAGLRDGAAEGERGIMNYTLNQMKTDAITLMNPASIALLIAGPSASSSSSMQTQNVSASTYFPPPLTHSHSQSRLPSSSSGSRMSSTSTPTKSSVSDVFDPTRPFPCLHLGCGKYFVDASKLKRHSLVHSAIRTSFVCQALGCGKVFTLEFNLRSHARTHTGEQPFVCDDPSYGCGKRFAQKSNLKVHVQRHEQQIKEELDDASAAAQEAAREANVMVKEEAKGKPADVIDAIGERKRKKVATAEDDDYNDNDDDDDDFNPAIASSSNPSAPHVKRKYTRKPLVDGPPLPPKVDGRKRKHTKMTTSTIDTSGEVKQEAMQMQDATQMQDEEIPEEERYS